MSLRPCDALEARPSADVETDRCGGADVSAWSRRWLVAPADACIGSRLRATLLSEYARGTNRVRECQSAV